MKYGVLVMGITDQQVKQHLVRNSGRVDSLGKARDELLEIWRTQSFLQNNPQPMQIGATPQKGKKGDKGNGKGKDLGKKGSSSSTKGDKGKGQSKDISANSKDKLSF